MGFLNAIGFLTIFRIPKKVLSRNVSRSHTLFNFVTVGLVIGLVLAASYYLLDLVLPSLVSIILVVGIEIIISGGIHIDGLSDVSDGIFSGNDKPEKILAIMKKGNIGVFGAMALIFDIILRIAFLFFIQKGLNDTYLMLTVLLFMPAFGRFSMVYLISFFKPTSRISSLTAFFDNNKSKAVFCLSLVFLFLMMFLIKTPVFIFYKTAAVNIFIQSPIYIGSISILATALVFSFLILAAYAATRFFSRKLDGITGDVIGSVNEVVELTYLFITLLLIRFLGLF